MGDYTTFEIRRNWAILNSRSIQDSGTRGWKTVTTEHSAGLIFDGLINRYLESTAKEAARSLDGDTKGFFATDQRVFKTVFSNDNNQEEGVQVLVRWMGSYGIIQGLRTAKSKDGKLFTEIVAKTAMRLYKKWGDRDARLEQKSLLCRFAELNRSIGESYPKERSFLSMTSKLLWLQYRTATPIYDENARIALNVLHKVFKSIDSNNSFDLSNKGQKRPRHARNSTAHEKDIANYDHFCSVYFAIYRPLEEKISRKLEQHNCCLEPIRYFDRILWVLGSRSEDFGLSV